MIETSCCCPPTIDMDKRKVDLDAEMSNQLLDPRSSLGFETPISLADRRYLSKAGSQGKSASR